MILSRSFLLLLATAVAGCASMGDTSPRFDTALPLSPARPAPVETAAGPLSGVTTADPDPGTNALQPRVFPGTDRMVKADIAPRVDPVLTQGERVSLNFENVNVGSLAAALLGDLLKVSYTIDAGADILVSLRTSKPLARKQILDVLDAVLLPHDLAVVRDAAGVYHVTQRSATAGAQPLASASRVRDLAGAGTVIVPLAYIGAGEMAKILRPLAPRDAFVHVDTLRNLLVLRGSKAQLAGWLEMVEAFDVDYLSGMSLGVFPLEYVNVSLVYDTLRAMLTPGSSRDSETRVASDGAQAPSSGSGAAAVDTGASALPGDDLGPLAGLVRLFPVERLNALVVVSPRSHMLTQVETWIRRLDQPSDALEAGLFVYPVQNGSAKRLAELLNGLFGGAETPAGAGGIAAGQAPMQFGQPVGSGSFSTTDSASGTRMAGTAPGFGGTSAGTATGGASFGFGAAGLGTTAGGGDAGSPTVSELEGRVRVVADETRNALLIRAPRTEYRRIERALRQLDQAATQVLIEASIVEITLSGDLKYGVEWAFQNRVGGGRSGTGVLSNLDGGELSGSQAGFSYSIVNNAGVVRATLNALAKKSQLRVLSNPSILVLDNHNATIQVGDQQPVRTGSATIVNGAVISEAISYKDTGVMLSVTPSVNASGLISLAIVQGVTDIGEIDAATGQRNFLTRQIQSQVAVRTGETIVLGGMMRENATVGRSGVPVLGDIPVLGTLFSTTTDASTRTELIVMLTPRVLENDDQLRAASVELRERMRLLDWQPRAPQSPAVDATSPVQ